MRIRKDEIDISIILQYLFKSRRFDPQAFKGIAKTGKRLRPKRNRGAVLRVSEVDKDFAVGEVEIIKPVDEGFFDDFPSFFHRHERSGSTLGVQIRCVRYFSLAVGICHCNALPSSSAHNVQNNRLFPKIPSRGTSNRQI